MRTRFDFRNKQIFYRMELKQGVQAELPSLLDLQLYIPVIVAVIVVVLYL